MDFLEHDLKTLLDDMREPFLPSEIKTLMLQILSGLEFLHSHWIMHRDLKTSNLLMNNRGEIKIADFGMARYYGDPPPKLTQLVVTLWYRSPELLLGAEKYGPEIDMWSIGCIFGELLTKEPLLQGKNEVDQVSKVKHLLSFCRLGPFALTDKTRYSLSRALLPSKRGLVSAPFLMPNHFAFHLHPHRGRLKSLPYFPAQSSPFSPMPVCGFCRLYWH
jgi:cell division cycle 2-like protein